MPIVKLGADSDAGDNQTTVPQTLARPSKSNFTTLFPVTSSASLLKYTEGYPWEVNYYGQILNTDNSLTHIDPTTPSLLQPYYEALGVVIQVSAPLTSSYDEVTAITSVTGSAVAPFGLKPNVGDVFISSVDTGEDAYFIITSVVRKTHRKETLYEITYSLYKYVSADPAFYTALKNKIQETYHFNKEGKSHNRELLITPVFKEAMDRSRRFVVESMQYYFQAFVQREAGTLFLPGTEVPFYDPLILEFILKTVPHDALAQTRLYNFTIADRYNAQSSILDLFMLRNKHLHVTINKTYSFVDSGSLRNYSRFGTAFHAGVTNVLYPKAPNTSTDITSLSRYSPVEIFSDGYKTVRNSTEVPLTVQTKNNDNLFTKNLLPSMFLADYYIVNEHFYTYLFDNAAYTNISFFELLLCKFIKREAIALEDLVILSEHYEKWSLLQQFYLLPLVWAMIANT